MGCTRLGTLMIPLVVFGTISMMGVATYGWINLLDELVCGLGCLIAYLVGSLLQNGEIGGSSGGGGGFGPNLSGLAAILLAPAALLAGLLVGAMFPPWSNSEKIAMGVASLWSLAGGFLVSASR